MQPPQPRAPLATSAEFAVQPSPTRTTVADRAGSFSFKIQPSKLDRNAATATASASRDLAAISSMNVGRSGGDEHVIHLATINMTDFSKLAANTSAETRTQPSARFVPAPNGGKLFAGSDSQF